MRSSKDDRKNKGLAPSFELTILAAQDGNLLIGYKEYSND